MSISITLIIIIITAIISFMAFSNQELLNKLIFYPPAISKEKQWYRFFSNGLIHADIGHLAFNMISLYMFGALVEDAFLQIFGDSGKLLYLVMYISALAVCLIPTYMSHKDDHYYRSLGASGAVSAVVFAGVFLAPRRGLRDDGTCCGPAAGHLAVFRAGVRHQGPASKPRLRALSRASGLRLTEPVRLWDRSSAPPCRPQEASACAGSFPAADRTSLRETEDWPPRARLPSSERTACATESRYRG